MPKYVSPMKLSDEHMRLVGIIAAHWETIDLILTRVVAEAMSFKYEDVGILVSNISFETKCNLLMASGRPLQNNDPANWKKFTAILECIRSSNRTRNTYVHAQWFPLEQGEVPIRSTMRVERGKIKIADEPTPISDLENAAQEIHQTAEKLTEFFQDFGLLQS